MATPGDFEAAVRVGVQMRALQKAIKDMPEGTLHYERMAAELQRVEEAFDRFAAIAMDGERRN
jgi:hypothetical protein